MYFAPKWPLQSQTSDFLGAKYKIQNITQQWKYKICSVRRNVFWCFSYFAVHLDVTLATLQGLYLWLKSHCVLLCSEWFRAHFGSLVHHLMLIIKIQIKICWVSGKHFAPAYFALLQIQNSNSKFKIRLAPPGDTYWSRS